MKRITAILLAVVMVACTFTVMTTVSAAELSEEASSQEVVSEESVSEEATSEEATSEEATSEESTPEEAPVYGNLALNRPYTLGCDDDNPDFIFPACPDVDGKVLTDGATRKAFMLEAGGPGRKGLTVEFQGTFRTSFITISLDGLNTVDSVVLNVAHRGGNRYTNVPKIEVLANGAWKEVAATETATPIPDAPQYAKEEGAEGKDQFFDIEYKFDAVENVSKVRVSLDTKPGADADRYSLAKDGDREYIVQLDEVQVLGTKTGAGTGGDTPDTPVDPDKPVTPPSGDLGLGVFAILAVVSLAGVVVAKKSR